VIKMSGPVRVGFLFGFIGLALTVLGIVRGAVPLRPANMALALVIGFGVWFLVSWAVAQAAGDVEEDLMQADLVTAESAAGELSQATDS